MKRERKNCKQPGVKGVVVVKTLVKTLWFLKRLVYHMKDILLWNKGSPYLHKDEMCQNSVQQAFPTEEQDRSFPCGKVATLWLSPFLHITLKSAYDVQNLHSTTDIRTEEAHRPDTTCFNTCYPINWDWLTICNLKVQTLVSLSSVDVNVLDWCVYDVSSWELGKVKQGQRFSGLKVSCSSPPYRLQLSISAPQSTRNHFRGEHSCNRLK